MASKRDGDTLNDRQRAFAAEYCVDRNATQAAIRAGYAPKAAGRMAHDLLKNPKIKAEIDRRLAKSLAKIEVSADRVTQELARVAFGGLSTFIRIDANGEPVVDLSAATKADLDMLTEATVETSHESSGARELRRVKVKTADKIAALRELAKILQMVTQRHEHGADADMMAWFEGMMQRGSRAPLASPDPDED